jgi:hypothetical protein
MGQSQIKALKTFTEGFSVYAVLVADPATGKTPALNLTRHALAEIEVYLGVSLENSRLVNG